MLDWVVLTGAGRASFGSKEGLREGDAQHVPALFEGQCVNLRHLAALAEQIVS